MELPQTAVDGLYGLCKQSHSTIASHHVINDVSFIDFGAFASAAMPVSKESAGLTRLNGKRPDGLTLTPGKVNNRQLGKLE